MEKENTHIVFDGQRVLISPNLLSIFDFLQKIEKEIETLLGFETKLNEIRTHYLEMIELVQVMAKVIKDNNLDFQYTFTKPPDTVAEKLSHYYITRAEMIVLFANLETLMCLYIAYVNGTDDENQIKKLLTRDPNNVKKYINSFLLTVDNPYYKDNQVRFKNITHSDIRALRNTLTHFFSVRGFALTSEFLKEKARILESKIPNTITFISPQEMYKLIQGGALLMLKKWNFECQNQPLEFERKITKVKSIVERDGPKMFYEKEFSTVIS